MPFPSLNSNKQAVDNAATTDQSSVAGASVEEESLSVSSSTQQQQQQQQQQQPQPMSTPSRKPRKVRSKLSMKNFPTSPRLSRGPSLLGRGSKTPAKITLTKSTSSANSSKQQATSAQSPSPAVVDNVVGVVSAVPSAVGENGVGNNNNNGQPRVHSGDTLENYVVPLNLRMDAHATAVDSGVNNQSHVVGIEVIKVSKNGKQQTRRLGIAPNNRAIYITTHKVHYPQKGRVSGLFKKGGDHHDHEAAGGPVKEVDLSRVVRMQLGQQSRRFVKARNKQFANDTTTTTPQSLSIIYRRSFNSTKDKLVKTMKKGATSQIVMDAGEDSLDLIIPSKSDFLALTKTLEDLLAFYQEEEPCANPDHAWIEYHLVDMGKSLVSPGGTEDGDDRLMVSCSDWVTLCKRWNAPVSKGEATAMYKAFCESLAISNVHTEGLEMFEVVRLLEVLRQRGLEASGGGRGEDGREMVEDPRKRLFRKIAQSESSGDSSVPSEQTTAISAEEFLKFVHERQNEMDMTLDDVKDLFYQLNGHRVSPQLEDAISVISGYRSLNTSMANEAVSWEREYISWEAFGRYLLLESNDVFDPERAQLSHSYMTQPLNNYWINTSHDTYLRRTKASAADHKQSGKTDLQSYTLALYRGARAIELDVWDGPAGNNDPLVRFGVTSFSKESAAYNKSSSSNSLVFGDVILTIGYFLQSEPQSFPVILLIENHCSLAFQEKMASDIEEILGKQNLLYRPDPSAKETDAMPSPAQLRGKVVIKSKLPTKILGESVVLNDDFDDENRESTPPSLTDYDSEDDIKENVVGFSSTGSIKSPLPQKLTAEQLFQTARSKSIEATSTAKAFLNQLVDVRHHAQQSQNHADALLRDIGMGYDELKTKPEEGSENGAEEGTEVELCRDGRASKVKETPDRAIEIAKVFAETVEESRLLAIAATTEARSETELFEIAREDLTDKEALLAEANEELQEVSKSNRDLVEAAERALSEARTNRQYAENAERRITAVLGLVDRSHNQAVSSETVAGTADAEAKISEQRASDAEARFRKARANEENERRNAEQETKLEDELEEQLIAANKELGKARDAVSAARERADDAVVKAEKLTNEIREAKSAGYDDEISVEESSIIANQKSKERKVYIGQMEKALTDKLVLESSTRRLESKIDDLQRKGHLQAKVAASARRQADHSMSIADQLEEHALEEREAADLRQAACVKAKIGVESSDAVLTSTETQLTEAEKAASEADDLALASRRKAEQLAKEAEAVQDVVLLEENVRLARESWDVAHSIYESAKEFKEEALERSAKAKQVHETNCVNLANLERDAMSELLHKESVQQAELLATTACENAKALSDQVDVLEKKYEEAKALATEKSGALEIATRYKEKKRRVQPISPSLSKSTLLHSANLRNWDKSFQLPNYAMHSIPDKKVIEMAELGKEEWKRWGEFNKTHFSRTYPESASRNYNPLLPWAMGCQFVSMNFIRNKFMLLNDGRFRENGGQGYVLKPEYLCHNIKDESEDVVNGALLDCTQPRQLSIRILSGFCLPKSVEKKSSSTINAFVRVTLYDGSPTTQLPSPVFKTHVVEGNGLNPVWNGQEAANFSCLNPSVGMLLFAVYDHCNITKTDLFICASAMPVSCIREGYRCVSLFDSNSTRSGAMKYASLFIKVKIEL